MSELEEEVSALLDGVEDALQRVKNSVQQSDDLDGAFIRLEATFSCLVWVEPVFESLVGFSSLLSAVSEMMECVESLFMEQQEFPLRG